MKNQHILAIGNTYDSYRELMALYQKLLEAGLQPKKDIVVLLGDYCDRGYDSKKVVEQCMEWHRKYPQYIFLRGNHEDIFENWINSGQKYEEDAIWSCFFYNGGKETLLSYGVDQKYQLPKDHLNFLFKETKILYETDKYVFVHGGLVPDASTEKSKNYSKNAQKGIKSFTFTPKALTIL